MNWIACSSRAQDQTTRASRIIRIVLKHLRIEQGTFHIGNGHFVGLAFPLCVFGCARLYEHGFITVTGGTIRVGRPANNSTDARTVKRHVGRTLDRGWLAGQISYFDNLPVSERTEV